MSDLTVLDVAIIVAYFALSLAVGLAFQRRAGRSVAEYFVSGRALPWWLAGTSMVATTFAADTPLAVTELVAKEGIAGNWVWWSFLPGALATVFFFAALWHRAGVITDVELVSLRYSGAPARWLRGFRAVYLGVLMNGIIMGWVNRAMADILQRVLGVNEIAAVGLCLGITVLYSTLGGLWGIVVTDAVQFVIAMGGTIALAFFAMDAVGGLDALMAKLPHALHPTLPTTAPWGGREYGDLDALLSFLPRADIAWTVPVLTLAVYLSLNWWSNWYPSAEPGGGGYIAQRLFATRNERHAVLAGLWFNIANYAIRPWPWIITGLAGIALYGNTLLDPDGVPNPRLNYIQVMIDYLPSGWRGLLLAAFAAAYMSTISTQLNWGASYLINDLYLPFVRPKADSAHLVRAGRVMTLVILVISVGITFFISSIEGAWKFLLGLGAGTGLVLMLRWYWWRINAWSEIASMIAALITSTVLFATPLGGDGPDHLAWRMIITLAVTTTAWVCTTFLTRPESEATLRSFCARVRPPGPGWRRIDPTTPPMDFAARLAAWASSVVLVYAVLFGTGHLLLGRTRLGLLCGVIAVITGALLARLLRHRAFHDREAPR